MMHFKFDMSADVHAPGTLNPHHRSSFVRAAAEPQQRTAISEAGGAPFRVFANTWSDPCLQTKSNSKNAVCAELFAPGRKKVL